MANRSKCFHLGAAKSSAIFAIVISLIVKQLLMDITCAVLINDFSAFYNDSLFILLTFTSEAKIHNANSGDIHMFYNSPVLQWRKFHTTEPKVLQDAGATMTGVPHKCYTCDWLEAVGARAARRPIGKADTTTTTSVHSLVSGICAGSGNAWDNIRINCWLRRVDNGARRGPWTEADEWGTRIGN